MSDCENHIQAFRERLDLEKKLLELQNRRFAIFHDTNTQIMGPGLKMDKLQDLQDISRQAQKILQKMAEADSNDSTRVRDSLQLSLGILKGLGCGDPEQIPRQLRWVAVSDDAAPLGVSSESRDSSSPGATSPSEDQARNDGLEVSRTNDDTSKGSDAAPDNEKDTTAGSDWCVTCKWKIGVSEPRWRCMVCREVQCDFCHKYFYETAHTPRCGEQNQGLGVILEHSHPSTIQLEAASCNNLAEALYTILRGFSKRPCFCPHGTDDWLTYGQILDSSLRIAQELLLSGCMSGSCQVVLLFPAGSMEFYLWDIACILAGITTIGINSPPHLAPEDWPTTATHVVCDGDTFHQHSSTIPPGLVWLNAQDAMDDSILSQLVPYAVERTDKPDPESVPWTIFLTSGTTGKPKLIPETRRRFRKYRFSRSYPDDMKLRSTVSYLPPCWVSDRRMVYRFLHGGHRVGFSPPSPSLPQVIETMQKIRPTYMAMVPTLAQYLTSFGDPSTAPSLGGNLEHVGVGSAPVSTSMLRILKETYGMPDIREVYGSTELGGIASNGRILPHVIPKVRLRDPNNDDTWLDTTREGVIGELWIGDVNTCDIVELRQKGRRVRVIGRSSNTASYKLENGKWCCLVDIEDEITRSCCPDLFDEVMVWCNRKGMLVLLGSRKTVGSEKRSVLLEKVLQRCRLAPEKRPKAILLTSEPFPKTITHKLERNKIIAKYQQDADQLEAENPTLHSRRVGTLDAADLAAQVLGKPVDRTKSFLENGGDSMTAVHWLQEMKTHLGQHTVVEWRSLLSDPLTGQSEKEMDESYDRGFPPPRSVNSSAVPPPRSVNSSAGHVLLTGATGFFGKSVLQQLLESDNETVVVCLVRKTSESKIAESRRVLVVTSVPLELEYRTVIHLAANVNHVQSYKSLKSDNVDLTEQLLRLGLAPMVYCSTINTQNGNPPFPDGYTQSKWVSEQMVKQSGGSCFWPPLLVWGNSRDWLTRLIRHCLRVGHYPSSLGFVVICPVKTAAQDLLAGRPCSTFDLDLSDLFLRLCVESGMKPVSMQSFVTDLGKDPDSPAYPALPLFQGKTHIGGSRRPLLKVFPIDDWQRVWPLLRGDSL